MTEPIWKEIIDPDASPGSPRIYWRQFPDGSQQSCVEHDPSFQDWLAEGNTPEAPDDVDPWAVIREKRDQILQDTDWTMTPGCTVDQAQWAAYRQNLRDLTSTYAETGPESVVWPVQPSTSGPNTIEE